MADVLVSGITDCRPVEYLSATRQPVTARPVAAVPKD